MSRVWSRRPSPAMVVALVALFVALGGSAYAGLSLPRNSVGAAQLRTGAVTAAKLHSGAVTSSKVKDGSLLAKDFKAGQLPLAASGAQGSPGPAGAQGSQGVPGAQGPPGAPGAQGASETATGPAGGDLTGSYPNPSIAPGAVTDAQLADPTLTVSAGTGLTGGGSIALGASGTLGVADEGIGTTQLADGSITFVKFAPGTRVDDSEQLGGLAPSDYGAVLSGRIDGLVAGLSDPGRTDFGTASGISTATADPASLATLSPDRDLVARDFSVRLTAAPGAGEIREFHLFANGSPVDTCSVAFTATTCTEFSEGAAIPANSTLWIGETVGFDPAPADAMFAFRLTN